MDAPTVVVHRGSSASPNVASADAGAHNVTTKSGGSSLVAVAAALFGVIVMQLLCFVALNQTHRSVIAAQQRDQQADGGSGGGAASQWSASNVRALAAGADSDSRRDRDTTETCFRIVPSKKVTAFPLGGGVPTIAPVAKRNDADAGAAATAIASTTAMTESAAAPRVASDVAQPQRQQQPSSVGAGPMDNLKRAAVVVLGYNRPQHLARTLRSLQRATGILDLAGRFVSIDGGDSRTVAMASTFGPTFTLLAHPRSRPPSGAGPTFALAAHYAFVFNELLTRRRYSHLIVFEDDMDSQLAPHSALTIAGAIQLQEVARAAPVRASAFASPSRSAKWSSHFSYRR